ncbi:MAG: homoserine dehydrogenase [Bowdeniella nasicola]|nr:homoserine dehydrogenase [Bowdeniella nasicola]
MSTSALQVALLGCGTVGSEVVRLLQEQAADFEARCGAKLELTGIAVRDLEATRPDHVPTELLTTEAEELVERADLVIELIGGIEPARSLILRAINHGASVITGNKALLAAHGPQLYQAVVDNDVDLYYEAAVAGAVPVVYALRESLAGDEVTRISGIVNGTTNVVIDMMETEGKTFAEAVKTAQDLGYAEADPSADIDGYDAAAKIAIMASIAFHSRVALDQVHTKGISELTPEQLQAAKDEGYRVKLIATAERRAEGISIWVAPSLVPLSNPLSSISGADNAVVTESKAAGRLMFTGQGAGGAPTASAVLSDVVAAAAKRVSGGHAPRELPYAALPVLASDERIGIYQVRLLVRDTVGVLAKVAQIFADAGVSIAKVQQATRARHDAVLSLTTHATSYGQLAEAISQLRECDVVANVQWVIEVEG